MEPLRKGSPASATHAPVKRTSSPGDIAFRGILGVTMVVLLIITAVLASTYLITSLISSNAGGSAIKSKQYQALFLTNGQVYFGHLSSVTGSYVHLTNIYYLQVQSQTASTSQNQQVSLAKLGNELHGPEDSMYVSRSQVLFWENLKDNGKVVQAITSNQNGNKTP